MLVDGLSTAPHGLSLLQAIRTGRSARPPVAETFDFAIVELEPGRIVIETTPPATMLNPDGAITGGYPATMLDSACGLALQSSLAAGQSYKTLELKVAFHRGLSVESGPLRTTGETVSHGRRVAFTRGELHDRNGRLCASATSTLLVL
ncbi:PaaI family thioesterase [Tianweitania populi]|uniref:Thioesterase domain-containing protein n=1 Tax=Tianweitania populi TaxID=1607949 RepID=A0A8J3DRZ3_9HYPH|nr:PaaI family thioesterase [Tianweitania populi]GHD20749.1 hypothetical protein GCM10016234_33340 [Tianweitania populi]